MTIERNANAATKFLTLALIAREELETSWHHHFLFAVNNHESLKCTTPFHRQQPLLKRQSYGAARIRLALNAKAGHLDFVCFGQVTVDETKRRAPHIRMVDTLWGFV